MTTIRSRLFLISIHALREEGDAQPRATAARGAISIHALREEGDHRAEPDTAKAGYFYPRPPRGGRPEAGESVRRTYLWISIHALREEGDPKQQKQRRPNSISIHALREEGDQ